MLPDDVKASLHRLRGEFLDRFVELEGALDESAAAYFRVDVADLPDFMLDLLAFLPFGQKVAVVERLERRVAAGNEAYKGARDQRIAERGCGLPKELRRLNAQRNLIAHTRIGFDAQAVLEWDPHEPHHEHPGYVFYGAMRNRDGFQHDPVTIESLQQLVADVNRAHEDVRDLNLNSF